MSALHRFKSDAFEAIDKAAMCEFDETCLTGTPAMAPAEIKQLREASYVSQPAFARYLNISESTVEARETGAKMPSGAALKLLAIVRKHGLQIWA